MASQILSAHIDLQLKVMDFLFETIVVSILKCDNYPSDISRSEKIVTIWQFIECKRKIWCCQCFLNGRNSWTIIFFQDRRPTDSEWLINIKPLLKVWSCHLIKWIWSLQCKMQQWPNNSTYMKWWTLEIRNFMRLVIHFFPGLPNTEKWQAVIVAAIATGRVTYFSVDIALYILRGKGTP